MENFWTGFSTASSVGPKTDLLFLALLIFVTLTAFLVAILVIYCCWKFRAGAVVDRENPPLTSPRVEMVLISLMFVIGCGIFFWSGSDYLELRRPPSNALEIHVYPKQWMWKFQHADGRREANVLHVPRDRDIKLTMISQDVIHSFFVPAFRIKADILPGRYTSAWFRATKNGNFEILCAQYCGTNHSTMRAFVVVMEPSDFEKWTLGQSGARAMEVSSSPEPESGEALFARLGCMNCHVSGRHEVAPELAGLWHRRVRFADNSTAVADEKYLRQSILEPNAKVVRGYSPVMPTFKGLVSEEEITALISYIKTLPVGKSRTKSP